MPRPGSIDKGRDEKAQATESFAKPSAVGGRAALYGHKSAAGSIPNTNSVEKIVHDGTGNDPSVSPLDSSSSIPLDVRLTSMGHDVGNAKRAKTLDGRKP